MTARDFIVVPRAGIEGSTVRDVVMQLLGELGMTTIFGNPGSTELPMFRNLPGDFRYILGLQESVVVGMADGFAQATERAALVNLHSSAGLGHGMGNLFTAFRNNTPLVVTAGQQARSMLPHEPFLYAERSSEMPRPFVKWAAEPARAEDVPHAIARAWQIAMQPPRGPTFVSIPIDDWDRACAPLTTASVTSRSLAAPAIFDDLAVRLAAARQPVIVAGAGVANNGARSALTRLAERLGAGVWAAPMAARNPFPEDHALFRGFLPASREALVGRLAGCDLVLVLGAPAFTYHVEGSGPFVPAGAALVQIGDDPLVASRVPHGYAVVSDVLLAVEALLDRVPPRATMRSAVREALSPPPATRLTDALLVHRLQALRPQGIAIVEEAPSTRGPLHDLFTVGGDEEFHTCASGGLGHGLPAAIGVALGRDDGRPVLCLLGDGSAMYAIQGLWSAAANNADVRFVIVSNGGYAALEQFGSLFGIDPVGTRIDGLDFAALAQAQGMAAERVDRAEDLDAAIGRLFAGSKPRLLDVVVERD